MPEPLSQLGLRTKMRPSSNRISGAFPSGVWVNQSGSGSDGFLGTVEPIEIRFVHYNCLLSPNLHENLHEAGFVRSDCAGSGLRCDFDKGSRRRGLL